MLQSEFSIDFSQLWETERQTLAECADHVPDNGIIVEIGTAQGGSAYIFHKRTASRNIKIYSFDIAPSAQAYEHLKDTNITIISRASVDGAADWKESEHGKIDLLFIDGSHALQHVFEDFNAWVPFLKNGATVVFHDFDSVERGGLVHFGTYIVLQTILRCKLLDRPTHKDRLLYGIIREPDATQLSVEACQQTLLELGQQISRLLDSDYTDWKIIGNNEFVRILAGGLRIEQNPTLFSDDPESLSAADKYLVVSRPLASILETLKARKMGSGAIISVDNLQLCYVLDRALHHNRDYLLEITQSLKEFFKWEELLFMLEHAYGPFTFPDKVDLQLGEYSLTKLSQFAAGEQVRLTMLARLLESFFLDWKP